MQRLEDPRIRGAQANILHQTGQDAAPSRREDETLADQGFKWPNLRAIPILEHKGSPRKVSGVLRAEVTISGVGKLQYDTT